MTKQRQSVAPEKQARAARRKLVDVSSAATAGTSTGEILASAAQPITGADSLRGGKAAGHIAADTLRVAILKAYNAPMTVDKSAQTIVKRLFALFAGTTAEALDEALNLKTSGFERNTQPYTRILETKSFRDAWRTGAEKRLSAEAVIWIDAKGEEREGTTLQARLACARAIVADVRSTRKQDEIEANAYVDARNALRANGGKPTADQVAIEATKRAEVAVARIKAEKADKKAERETPEAMGKSACERLAKAHGAEWLAAYGRAFVKTARAIIDAHNTEQRTKAEQAKAMANAVEDVKAEQKVA